MKVSDQN